ncbi:MAG: hypothetical protein Q7J12_00295 [Syntrophales bacterium]|nr:hypothetical protein [Syntrophales bacterium]
MNISVTNFIQNLPRYFKSRDSRNAIIFFSALLCLYILIVPAFIFEKKSEKVLASLQTKLKEFSNLTDKYNELKVQVNAIDGKRSLSKTRSIIQAVNEVFLSLGIKEKMKSLKGIENRDVGGQTNEESAEVQIEKLTLNELVQVFYKIENSPVLFSIKRVSAKKSFTSPELLDVTMTISLFTGPSVNPK